MSDTRGNATCGCCQGTHAETPRPVQNRAGLAAIAYRAGDYLSFRRSMFAALAATRLTTRADDDFSIALIDAWATAADVLTFYQERIANESYLGTARERVSVLELARTIGYELAPGVAASALLAFEVDTSEGAPDRVQLDAGLRVQSVPGQGEQPQTFETIEALDARAALNVLPVRRRKVVVPQGTEAWLDGTETNLRAGDGLLFEGTAGGWDFKRVAEVTPNFDLDVTKVTWSDALKELKGVVTVSAMRVQAPLFGANAVDPRTLDPTIVAKFDTETDAKENLVWKYVFNGKDVDLDGSHREIASGTKLVLLGAAGPVPYTINSVNEVSVANYATTGKATRLTLDVAPDETAFGHANYRTALAFAAPQYLPLGEAPPSGTLPEPIVLQDAIDWPDPQQRRIIVADDNASEPAEVKSVSGNIVTLSAALTNHYDIAKVKIYANVAAATHGETVREVLGSGDAATPFQTFTLSQKPLTYVYSADGSESTLRIFVNDIEWHEVDTLYAAGPHARVFVTRRDDDGVTTVQFGDGVNSGARLPTGSHNVRAVYRKGLGTDGNVAPHKLTLLLTNPLGLAAVDNPRRAEGGGSAEKLEDARTNAPRTVLTLDRVVSLLDYQSFASSFPGIGKALATWRMLGTSRQVLLTVAGPRGEELTSTSPAVVALGGALISHGDPYVPLRIASFHRAAFNVVATVRIEKDRVADDVLGRVRQALRDAFSFDARSFGEAVDLSDVITVMQNVDGVDFIDVNVFDRDPGTGRQDRLSAAVPHGNDDRAEILVLGTADITENPR